MLIQWQSKVIYGRIQKTVLCYMQPGDNGCVHQIFIVIVVMCIYRNGSLSELQALHFIKAYI